MFTPQDFESMFGHFTTRMKGLRSCFLKYCADGTFVSYIKLFLSVIYHFLNSQQVFFLSWYTNESNEALSNYF